MTKSAHWWSLVMWFALVIWEVFSRENTQEDRTETYKCVFSYKQVSERNGDHEWLRMTNAFILCDQLWKVQNIMQRTEKVALNTFVNLDWSTKLLSNSGVCSFIIYLRFTETDQHFVNTMGLKTERCKLSVTAPFQTN